MVVPAAPSAIAALVSALIALLTAFGVTLGPDAHEVLANWINAIVTGLFALMSLIAWLVGMYNKAKKEDSDEPKDE